MAKKQYFLIIDTETTKDDTVADFGAVLCDRNGNVEKTLGILLKGHFDEKELFYTPESGFWGREGAIKRRAHYVQLLENGTRNMASVTGVNRWLEQVAAKYNPTLCAYNLAFDLGKMRNTGIDVNLFPNRFCLWHAAIGNICESKAFKKFALENHCFNNRTELANMTMQTNAEVVAGFLQGMLTNEPHTALEDALDYELPILKAIVKKAKWQEKIKAYNWRDFQVKNHFQPK
jgi:hypothetical protein